MNIARYAIEKKAVTIVFILTTLIGGISSYFALGQLEDPEFTIKTAVIYTIYPGATSGEVEKEVTERLETSIQRLKQLDEVRSLSRAGVSIIYADVKDSYDKETLPQVWDELRRKISQAARDLPPGCSEPVINDDFGDVYGHFFAITGDGYSYHDLRKYADDLRRELLLCDQVGRVDFWGNQQELIYIEIDRAKLSHLGLPPQAIFTAIDQQNAVVDAGSVKVQGENISLRITGESKNIEDLGEILVHGGDSRMIRIRDVAHIKRGYLDPPQQLLFRNGQKAIGIGVSCILGGNVVDMGNAIKNRIEKLKERTPVGIKIDPISFQAETVSNSVDGFIINLFEAVAIVVLLLVIFMGLHEGIIIGIVLLLTILATFIGMEIWDVNLQRISLGALIIALGMLVDNAIVVAEGILVKSHAGMNKKKAAEETVHETQWPLFGATVIAILAFAAISISKDVTGEFLGSLFKVIALSLSLSWVFAVTVCPYLCVTFIPQKAIAEDHPHDNWFYTHYSSFLKFCIRHKALSIGGVVLVLCLSMYAFGYVPKDFFPNSTRPQFKVDVWLPEGAHIKETEKTLAQMSEYIKSLEGVSNITTFVGAGAMRFMLTYNPESANSNYGQLLIDVEDYTTIKKYLLTKIQRKFEEEYPETTVMAESFKFGPSSGAVEARIIGPDTDVLRNIAEQIKTIMQTNDNTRSLRHDWGNRTKAVSVILAESQSRKTGVSRTAIAQSLQMTFDGSIAGLYRDGEDLIPIMLRPPMPQRNSISNLNNTQVWSATKAQNIPITQVTDGVETIWEDAVIQRKNRKRTITVSCQQRTGTADTLFKVLRPQIENIPLPPGYELEWGGQYESSKEANTKLMAKVPLAFSMMFFITVMLFNTLRHPLIIFLGIPLALIGVSAGLFLTQQPFNFVATLGVLSLAGMLIKNEIVLLDQINLEIANGKDAYNAVISSAISRVRPVSMASFTTVLGMIPLLWDGFFVSMAITIMAGLTFATILTLVIVPVLYTTFFRVKKPISA